MATFLIETPAPQLPALEFVRVHPADPRATFLLADLQADYDRLYPSQAQVAEADKEINAYPAEVFTPEQGGDSVLLLSEGEAVAGGAMMRTGDCLAPQGAVEFKRIWTHPNYRGRGLSKYLLRELELRAAAAGYRHVYLTTGPAQPTAVKLYEGYGYQTVDLGADTGAYHAFTKPLDEHITVLEQRQGRH